MSSSKNKIRPVVLIVLALSWLGLSLLVGRPQNPPKKKIILEHADQLTYDKNYRPDFKRLIGNVSLKHGKATMTCDSAYLNDATNSFNGYGNIHMHEDTIDIYSDSLYYDGVERIARLRDHVRLENGKATLFTDSLDYDRNTSTGYYINGGQIVDPENTLTSDYGEYNTETDEAYFSGNVVLRNKDFTMTTEELIYNTTTNIATILGETLIDSDSGYIETTRGYYDTKNNVGILLDNSKVHSKDAILIGDSIFYDGKLKFGEVFGNMSINDTVKKAALFGQYGYYDENKEYAFATMRSFGVDYSRPDTLYVGADTLELITYKGLPNLNPPRPSKKSEEIKSSAKKNNQEGFKISNEKSENRPSNDSGNTDGLDNESTSKTQDSTKSNHLNNIIADSSAIKRIPDSVDCHIMRAYHHMRLYRKDAQAVSDSLEYVSVDSVLSLYRDATLWHEKDQLSADLMKAYFKNDSLYAVTATGKVFGMEQIDTAMYNQLSCEQLNVFFKDSTVNYLEAFKSVNSIYFLAKEKTQDYYAMNRMTSDEMYVYIENDSVQKAKWIPAKGKIYPVLKTEHADRRLEGFEWLEMIRPMSPEDIFLKDDTIKYTPPTLSDLRRFSGAKAAMRAYDALERQLHPVKKENDKAKKTPVISRPPSNKTGTAPHHDKDNDSLSPFIRRNDTAPYVQPKYNYLQWVYLNPTSTPESQENSVIL